MHALWEIAALQDYLESLERGSEEHVWIDVGAYRGEVTLPWARKFPHLRVYAFEPNVKLAAQAFGLVPNYTVIPMAVCEQDGFSRFHMNRYPGASSLLPFNPKGLREWKSEDRLEVEREIAVPTIRLDTFMERMNIERVDLLKVDAQGADFSVVSSAWRRLKYINRVVLEVTITREQLYLGGKDKDFVVDFMTRQGFSLLCASPASHGQEENLTFGRV